MEIKKRVEILRKNNKLLQGELESKQKIIMFRSNAIISKRKFLIFEYSSEVKMNKKKYEAILFNKEIHENVVNKIFNIILSMDFDKLFDKIDFIQNVFKILNEKIDYKKLIGDLGELKFLSENKSKNFSYISDSDVFDFKDEQNFYEIKSVSGNSDVIFLSKQQITNSKNAKVFIYKINESDEGISIHDLIRKNNTFANRYSKWIKIDFLGEILFKIKKIKEFQVKDLNLNIVENKIVKNYTLEIKIDMI